MEVNELGPTDDPWIWTHDAVNGEGYGDDIGLAIFDSGTSLGDILLHACSHAPTQIGQQKTQRFAVNQGSGKDAKTLTVSINNEAHFGVVQGFMLEAIRNSTWLTRRGIDVLWTFALFRGEDQGRTPILGPKVAGKALTPFLPKEFKYTFRIDSIPQEGTTPVHRLYLTEHPELAGLGHSFGNARYPLGVTPLPPYVEPASLPEALDLIAAGHDEARQQAEAELL